MNQLTFEYHKQGQPLTEADVAVLWPIMAKREGHQRAFPRPISTHQHQAGERPETTERRELVADAYTSGMRPVQIARTHGIPFTKVVNDLKILRERGDIAKKEIAE